MIMRNFVHILAVVAVVAASPAAAYAEEQPPSDTAPAPPAPASPPPASPPPVLTAPHLDDKPPKSNNPKHTVIPPGHTVPDEPFTHDESPYALRLDLDIATLALGTVLWAGTSFVGPTGGAFCGTSTTAPCAAALSAAARSRFRAISLGSASSRTAIRPPSSWPSC